MATPQSFSVRPAIVRKLGRTYIDFEFLDRPDKQTYRTTIPHPYAGRGGGVFAGIEKDTIIIVAYGPGEKWYVLTTIPDHNFFFNLDGASNIRFDETSYPYLKPGEIIVKGNKGQTIELTDDGNISLDAGASYKSRDIELSKNSRALYNRVDQIYEFTEFGRAVKGIIQRDMNPEENSNITNTVNFLDSEAYDRLLSQIGRHPQSEVQNRTSTVIRRAIRNPALVEKRSILYEYADSFNVQNFQKEADAVSDVEKDPNNTEINLLQKMISDRQNRRTDILNLNLNNFNHLIEHVEGTVVDIYGNILDINRNPINIPDVESLPTNRNASSELREIYDYHRRSIKLHYEINSRKPISSAEPSVNSLSEDNASLFSRWSIDVDGEGLTKINIPKSSDTGNIPVLGRYFTSRSNDSGPAKYFINEEGELSSGSFKDANRKDIRIKSFGPGGISIENDDYIPESIDNSSITIGTAWHDMSAVASGILGESPITTNLNNKVGNRDANAGGRSLNMNLDGSWELSIGADNVDKKSMLLDTKGGIIAHIGSDNNARSITASTDGEVNIEIGGTPISDFGPGFPQDGKLVIHINNSFGGPSRLIIDNRGMTLDVPAGGMYFRSGGDMVFEASGKMLLQAADLGFYGAGDIESRRVGGVERKVLHTGIPNHM